MGYGRMGGQTGPKRERRASDQAIVCVKTLRYEASCGFYSHLERERRIKDTEMGIFILASAAHTI